MRTLILTNGYVDSVKIFFAVIRDVAVKKHVGIKVNKPVNFLAGIKKLLYDHPALKAEAFIADRIRAHVNINIVKFFRHSVVIRDVKMSESMLLNPTVALISEQDNLRIGIEFSRLIESIGNNVAVARMDKDYRQRFHNLTASRNFFVYFNKLFG